MTTKNELHLSDHLIQLPEYPWAYWRTVLLRSAGFPADDILRLGDGECRRAADRWIDSEERARIAFDECRRRIAGAVEALLPGATEADRNWLRVLQKVRKSVATGKLPAATESLLESFPDEALRKDVAQCRDRVREMERSRRDLVEEYDRAVGRQSEKIFDLAGSDRFREAILWQSRSGYQTGVARLLAAPPEGRPNSSRRRKEELVASYLQRYCAKNDTIGYFGPAAWADLADSGPVAEVVAGPGLIARCRTFLEDWCFDEVAKRLAQDPQVRPWLKPNRLPYVVLHGSRLFLPQQPPVDLPPSMAALLRACDGATSAADIAARLAADADLGLPAQEAVFGMLHEAVERKLVVWQFEVPMGAHAGDVLRRQVAAIGAEAPRRRCTEALDALEEARRGVEAAAGDPDAVDGAIAALEERFTQLTGEEATRHAGKTYGARTLVYQDCLRDVEARLGPDFQRRLTAPLSLVMQSARWLIASTAEDLAERFRQIHGEILAQSQAPVVPAGMFWGRVAPIFFGKEQHQLRARVGELQEKWRSLLQPQPEVRRVDLTSEALRSRVAELFPADTLGWPAARCHSPDVMIVAESLEAFRNDDYELVLGELHIGRNTLGAWGLMAMHPDREKIFRQMEMDIPETLVVPLPPRDNPRVTGRTHAAHLRAQDVFIPPMDGSAIVPAEKAVSFADLIVVERDGEIRLESPDGGRSFAAVHFFAEFIALGLGTSLDLLPPAPHWPRITIDRLVVRRESWAFPAAELSFALEEEEAIRFAGARRWARKAGLPRFCFIRDPGEMKPTYLDLESPVYVELMARSIRRASRDDLAAVIRVSEMLPDLEHLWLEDSEGRRYTSELRMLVVDRSV